MGSGNWKGQLGVDIGEGEREDEINQQQQQQQEEVPGVHLSVVGDNDE